MEQSIANLTDSRMRLVQMENGSSMEVNLVQKTVRGLSGEALKLCPYAKKYKTCNASLNANCFVELADGSFFRTKEPVQCITDSPYHYQHFQTSHSTYTLNWDTMELTSPDLAKSRIGTTQTYLQNIRYIETPPKDGIPSKGFCLMGTLPDGQIWHTSSLQAASTILSGERESMDYQRNEEERCFD